MDSSHFDCWKFSIENVKCAFEIAIAISEADFTWLYSLQFINFD